MSALSYDNILKNEVEVVAFAKSTGNPMYSKYLKEYEEALADCHEKLNKLLMVVKLTDGEELEKRMLDYNAMSDMTPSQRQLHRIKKGLWRPGSAVDDGLTGRL